MLTFLTCWAVTFSTLALSVLLIPPLLLRFEYGFALGSWRKEWSLVLICSFVQALVFALVIGCGAENFFAWIIVMPHFRRLSGVTHTLIAGALTGYYYYFTHMDQMDWPEPVILLLAQLLFYLVGLGLWSLLLLPA